MSSSQTWLHTGITWDFKQILIPNPRDSDLIGPGCRIGIGGGMGGRVGGREKLPR